MIQGRARGGIRLVAWMLTTACVALLLWAARAEAYVYWAEQGSAANSIGRAKLDGTGVNHSFITGASTPCQPEVTSTHIYWQNRSLQTIGRANIDGTGVNQNFITGLPSLSCGIAVNSTHIFWATGGLGDSVGRANIDGTGVNQNFITGADDPNGVAINSTHIFWGNRFQGIGRANLDGTGANQSYIPTDGMFPESPVDDDDISGVEVNANHIFWAAPFTGWIGRAGIGGSPIDEDFYDDNVNVSGPSVNSTHIFWTVGNSVARANLDGTGTPNSSFITGLNIGGGTALDALPTGTTTGVSCTPASVKVSQGTTCTATVTDGVAPDSVPTGTVTFGSDTSGGSFSANTCNLVGATATSASCSVTYTPGQFGTGTHLVSGSYGGDNEHDTSGGQGSVAVARRTTTQSLSCSPASVVVSQATTCTATITDNDAAGTQSAPAGAVSFASDTSGGAISSSGSCTLGSPTSNSSSCSVTYTPGQVDDGSHSVTATYAAGSVHAGGSDPDSVSVARRETSTSVTCSPGGVAVSTTTTCTATVADTDAAGSKSAPAGNVNLASDTAGGSLSSGGTCTLSAVDAVSSSCSVAYTPGQVDDGTHQLTGTYAAGSVHAGDAGTGDVGVSERATDTAVACAPADVTLGEATTCSATVTDTSGGTPSAPTGNAVFASDTPGGTLSSAGSCALAATGPDTAACSLNYTPGQVGSGSHQLTADYGGDASHAPSQGAGPVQVAAGELLLSAPNLAIIDGDGRFGSSCRMEQAVLESCRVTATPAGGGAAAAGPIARGSSSAASGTAKLGVAMRVTRRGKRLLRKRLGGVRARLAATGETMTGQTRTDTDSILLIGRIQKVIPPGPMFGPDSAELTAAGRAFLRRVRARVRLVGTVRCEGHTASVVEGDSKVSRDLGLARAQAACSFLRSLGLRARFEAISLGKRKPRASNATEAGRALNRRVSLTIVHRR